MTEDKPGVLHQLLIILVILIYLLKKYFNFPRVLKQINLPIIITTHNIQKEKLSNVINKIESLEFVKEKITVLAIHDN